MKKSIVFMLAMALNALHAGAFNISEGRWYINFDETSKYMSIAYNNTTLFTGVYGSAGYYFADDNSGTYWPETKDAAAWTVTCQTR